MTPTTGLFLNDQWKKVLPLLRQRRMGGNRSWNKGGSSWR